MTYEVNGIFKNLDLHSAIMMKIGNAMSAGFKVLFVVFGKTEIAEINRLVASGKMREFSHTFNETIYAGYTVVESSQESFIGVVI